ncbi:MAG: amidohydrolase family protein [Armatimonadota bacterium]|nr:amidohydrolase family protein [Armatimonadota bacterium]
MSYEDSKFRQIAMHREKLDGEYIVDFHSHTGGLCKWYHLPDSSTPEMINEMDRHGINKAVTFPFSSITSDYAHGNNTVAVAAKEYHDRLVGFACVNPHYKDEIKDELERCRQMGLRGIKLIPHYQKYPDEGPNILLACEYANDHSWPMLNHNWGSAEHLDNLAKTYKNACFIIGHYFGPIYTDVLARRNNVFQCTCAALNFGDIETLVNDVPAEKIVYGSDFTDLPIMFSMGPILYARISDDDKRKILGLTAKSVLERWPGK